MATAGYESATLGVWGWVCTLQLVVGLICTSVSHHLSHWEDIHNPAEREVSYVTASTFINLGRASFVFGIILAICVFIGYFVIPRFSNLLVGLAGMFSGAVSLACTILMGLISSNAMPKLIDFWRKLESPDVEHAPDYSVFFAYNMKPTLAAVGIGSFVSFLLAARALAMTSKATAVDATVYAGCLAIAGALGTYVVVQYHALRSLLALGIIWLLGLAILYILLNQQKMCWPRFTSVVVGVLSALLALLGLVGVSICSNRITKDKLYEIAVAVSRELALIEVKGEERETIIDVFKSSINFDYYVLAALSAAAVLAFLAATLAAFRSVLGPSPAEKEMAQDSAEEAVEGRSEA